MRKQQWTRNGRSSKKSSLAVGQSKVETEVILEAKKDKQKVHFATLMDICHLKNAECEPKFQKYKGRVVLRVDMVKGDSGAYTLFTEQGSSASQMTAAKVMDVLARLPDCARKTSSKKWRMLPDCSEFKNQSVLIMDTSAST